MHELSLCLAQPANRLTLAFVQPRVVHGHREVADENGQELLVVLRKRSAGESSRHHEHAAQLLLDHHRADQCRLQPQQHFALSGEQARRSEEALHLQRQARLPQGHAEWIRLPHLRQPRRHLRTLHPPDPQGGILLVAVHDHTGRADAHLTNGREQQMVEEMLRVEQPAEIPADFEQRIEIEEFALEPAVRFRQLGNLGRLSAPGLEEQTRKILLRLEGSHTCIVSARICTVARPTLNTVSA